MIVVGLLYNTNGMATWCLEVAHALHTEGKEVLLVVDETRRADLQKASLPFPTFNYPLSNQAIERRGVISKLIGLLKDTFDATSSGFAYGLEQELLKKGISPSLFLLNQSNLQDNRCKTPQYVVAWAYPASLSGYLHKTIKQTNRIASLSFLFALSGAVSWHKKDWRAYRQATGVLAVSQRLTMALEREQVKAHLLYPCMRFGDNPPSSKPPSLCKKVLLAAVDLESEQKRIPWVLKALAQLPEKDQIEFHLVGAYSTLPQQTASWGLRTVFTGRIKREELLTYMEGVDLFVFGSSFDDWGYVQVEALSKGLQVIAPNISPSDEIIQDQECLYDPESEADLIKKVKGALLREDDTHFKIQVERFKGAFFVKTLGAIHPLC